MVLREAKHHSLPYRGASRSENDRAFEWLDKAVAWHDTNLYDVSVEPMLRNLDADPRWLAFLGAHGLAPEQLAAIPFDIKLPD